MGTYTALLDELRQPTRELRRELPEPFDAFRRLHEAAVADGCLPARFKELIAIAIAVVDGCEGCIAYHARAAARTGAGATELAEALGVALLMGGGPASVMAPKAWAAFMEFSEPEAPAAPEHRHPRG
jgi:AhpD family alkylhydroperoxidase